MYHTEAEIKLLADTPLNRRLIKRWSEQDQRGITLQRTLFSQGDESEPRTPANAAPTRLPSSMQTAGVTFQICEDSEQDDVLQDQNLMDRAIVSRMIAGSSRSRTFSSASISELALGVINIQTEFPIVFELKKNKCASILSFVSWLKKHESFKWPTTEKGDGLRDVLSKLAFDLMAEFMAPPKLVAAVQMAALFVSAFHKSEFVSDFHSGLCHEDFEMARFRDECAQGKSNDSVLKFVNPDELPGFQRLVDINSAEHWVDMATSVIDSAAFMNIVLLEKAYNRVLARWKEFKVGTRVPKQARSVEQGLFSELQVSAERADVSTVNESDRAYHIIQGISLVVRRLGRDVEVGNVIRDAIAAAKMGRAAVNRKFVFDIYEEQFEYFEHTGAEFKKIQTEQGYLDHDTGEYALVTADATCDISINCVDCFNKFEFTASEQAFYADKGIEKQPMRCRGCKKKHVAGMASRPCHAFEKTGRCRYGDKCRFKHDDSTVMCIEEGADAPVEPAVCITDFYDSDDSDTLWHRV
jgi:hypothetical protein